MLFNFLTLSMCVFYISLFFHFYFKPAPMLDNGYTLQPPAIFTCKALCRSLSAVFDRLRICSTRTAISVCAAGTSIMVVFLCQFTRLRYPGRPELASPGFIAHSSQITVRPTDGIPAAFPCDIAKPSAFTAVLHNAACCYDQSSQRLSLNVFTMIHQRLPVCNSSAPQSNSDVDILFLPAGCTSSISTSVSGC